MNGYSYRDAEPQLDAELWRKRVIRDAKSAEGRAAAGAYEVSIDLVIAAAELIAAYMAAGESEISRMDLKISGVCSVPLIDTRQTQRLLRYLEDRGHIGRTDNRDLIRPVRGDEMPLR